MKTQPVKIARIYGVTFKFCYLLFKARFNGQCCVCFRAEAERDSILNRYKEEAATYKRITATTGLGLSLNELLSYVGVRMIQNTQSPMTVGLKAPANVSYAPQTVETTCKYEKTNFTLISLIAALQYH